MDWMFWMPDEATLNELLVFTGVLWLIHQVVSLGSALFFKSLHEKDRFPKFACTKGQRTCRQTGGVCLERVASQPYGVRSGLHGTCTLSLVCMARRNSVCFHP